MRKCLILILSMLFVLGFTVSAFAIHAEIPAETQAIVAEGTTQITLGGALRFRGEYRDNTTDFTDEEGDNRASYDGRVRLWLNAQVSPNTIGRIQLESNDCAYDNNQGNNTSDTYTWGTCGSQGAGLYGEGNGKRGDLRILEAWIQHTGSGLLGVPAGLKIGHMPLKLGNGLFVDHSGRGDDAIMLFADPTKELHIALVNAKFTEGNSAQVYGVGGAQGNDDTDAYVLLFNYAADGFNVGGDVTYLDDQDGPTVVGVFIPMPRGLHLWNFGLRGNTSFDSVNVNADIEIQNGKAKSAGSGGSDLKYRGYAFLVGADVSLDTVTLDAAIGYGSGDSNLTDNKLKTFITAQSSTQKFTYIYDYRVATSLLATNTGIANTTYYKIGANAKPVQDLSTTLDLYLLKATKIDGNFYVEDDKNIGLELDGKLTYQIDRNLVYFVEGGYLWAGDFYKNATYPDDPDNPWSVRHGVELTF